MGTVLCVAPTSPFGGQQDNRYLHCICEEICDETIRTQRTVPMCSDKMFINLRRAKKKGLFIMNNPLYSILRLHIAFY